MQRSAEQRTRKFLATTFKKDGPATSVRRMSPLSSTTFIIHFPNIEGPYADECSAVRISFFDVSKRVFFGTSYLAEIGLDDVVFHASAETTQVVIEAVRVDSTGEEHVACWWYVSLTELASTKALTLRRGCGDLLLLDRSVWPIPETTPPTVLHITPERPNSTLLTSLLPAGYCQDASIADLDSRAPLPFRLKVTSLQIQEVAAAAGTPSPLDRKGTWSCLVMAHNTHRMLSGCQELALRADVVGNLSSTKEVEIPHLPVHCDTSLVIALRFKEDGTSKYTPVGYIVFDLVTGVPTLRDCDVNVRNLPVLTGPFSCEDPRCLSLETEHQYTNVGLAANVKVCYYDTPISAAMVEEYEDGTPVTRDAISLVDVPPLSAGSGQPTNVSMAPSSAVSAELERLPTVPQFHETTNPPLATGEGGVPPLTPAAPPVPGLDLAGDNASGDIYRMLCDLMSEVRGLRRQRGTNVEPSDEMPRMDEHVDPSDADHQPTGFPSSVVALRPRRNVIPTRRRLLMSEKCRPLVHPASGQRLLATDAIQAVDLPNSLLMIRLEGITLRTSSFDMPVQLAVKTSFANSTPVQVGPMRTRRLPHDGDDFGISFSLAATDHTDDTSGAIWSESMQTAQDLAYAEYKASGTMYLHFYDAASMFYIGTCNLRLSRFQRPTSSLFAQSQIDLPLYEDMSYMERDPEPGVPLIVCADAGYVHLTIAAVGVAALETKAAAPAITTTTSVHVAERLDEAALINGGANPPKFDPPRGAEGFGEKRSHLHSERAKYVRHLLQDRTLNVVAQQINGGSLVGNGGDQADMEFKLRYVERRRDEVKSTKIAETLRKRMTVSQDVTVWMGGPKVVHTLFTNPYPVSTTFQIDIPLTSQHTSLHPSTPSVLTLGPKQDVNVKIIIAVAGDLFADFNTQVVIRTSRMEVAKVISVNVKVVEPLVHRRYEVFAPPGQTATKRIHLRAFPPAPAVNALPSMCHYCVVSTEAIEASTGAIVESLSATTVAAWEEVTISAKVGHQPVRAYLVLYQDAEHTAPYETWEISVSPCHAFRTAVVPFGQTSMVTIPFPSSRVYSADPAVEPIGRQDCTSLRVTPRAPGQMTFLLHSRMGDGSFLKVMCSVPCVLPTPTYEDYIDVALPQAGTPIFRRLQFTNREPVHKMFKVITTYPGHLHVAPEQFTLTPSESKQISIRIDNLASVGGEGRLPMWIFINDAENQTIDSYLITVSLRSFIPITPA